MGLSHTGKGSSPDIAQAPKGILDPATGRPVGANDPFFLEVNHELSDKGFFVAAAAAQGLRPDARAALRHLDGVVRQWRRLLSLFLLGRARLRPHRADRHLRARMPADGGGAALWRAAAAEEDPAHRDHRTLRF